jgi:hypothetical protein
MTEPDTTNEIDEILMEAWAKGVEQMHTQYFSPTVLPTAVLTELKALITREKNMARIDEIKVWLEATESDGEISTPLINDTTVTRAMEHRLSKLKNRIV